MTDKLALRTPSAALTKGGYAQRVKVPTAHDAERSRDTARNAASANTRRAYSSDWRIFEAWCDDHQLQALPCAEETLCGFNLARMEAGCSIRTVRRGMVSIRAKHTLAGFDDPYGTYGRLHWRGLRNEWYKRPYKAAPLYGEQMMSVIDVLSTCKLRELRSRAILLVGLCGALRRSEIVGLRVEDIEFNDKGMVVHIGRSKTDQIGKGDWVGIGKLPDTRYCPVVALQRWLAASHIKSDFIFQSMRGLRLTGRPLSAWQVSKMIQTVTLKVGLVPPNGLRWSAHSLRAGFMTGGAENGVPLEQLMAVSRHKNREQAAGYIRKDTMRESQTLNLGLGRS